jgi:hypothetical protein
MLCLGRFVVLCALRLASVAGHKLVQTTKGVVEAGQVRSSVDSVSTELWHDGVEDPMFGVSDYVIEVEVFEMD